MTLEILRSGPTWSRAMDVKGEKMLRQDFTPAARLAQHLKDVRLILRRAGESDAIVPLSTLHSELLQSLVAQGYGDLDNSVVIRAFTRPDGR